MYGFLFFFQILFIINKYSMRLKKRKKKRFIRTVLMIAKKAAKVSAKLIYIYLFVSNNK